jgi:hypothetical protein
MIQHLSSPLSVSPTLIPSLGSFLGLEGRSKNLKLLALSKPSTVNGDVFSWATVSLYLFCLPQSLNIGQFCRMRLALYQVSQDWDSCKKVDS